MKMDLEYAKRIVDQYWKPDAGYLSGFIRYRRATYLNTRFDTTEAAVKYVKEKNETR